MKWIAIGIIGVFGVYNLAKGIVAYRRHEDWAVVTYKTSLSPTGAILAGSTMLIVVGLYIIAWRTDQRNKRNSPHK